MFQRDTECDSHKPLSAAKDARKPAHVGWPIELIGSHGVNLEGFGDFSGQNVWEICANVPAAANELRQ